MTPARNTICLWYDHDAEEAARAERREFEMFRNHLRDFGYVFFLMQRS